MKLNKKTSREDKQALDYWEDYFSNLLSTQSIDTNETCDEQQKRVTKLETDPEKWFKYYFEKYCTAEPAPFHKRSTKRILGNMEWYEVRPWSRELAKSSRAMMEFLYLHLTGKKKLTFVVSATKESAINLLRPLKIALEKNARIIHDYGNQSDSAPWKEDVLRTKMGTMFFAIGAGNAPRGTKNENIRPDSVLVDDFDTDEDCRNPDMIDKKWKWFEQAVYGMRSISSPFLVLFNGNIIADDCCIKRAMKIADFYEIVNIRDKDGRSTWPQKNTEDDINRVLSKISHSSAQKEYFNNPIVLGKVFEKLYYGKIQPLRKYKFLVAYTDPSYKKNGDYKATALIGRYKDEYHVIWVRCRRTSVRAMIEWQFELIEFVDNKTALYLYIEYPWIDDALKLEIKRANKRNNKTLALKADERSKPDKFYRIESNLEPLNANGKLIFNEQLKGTEDMETMQFQFLALSPKSRANDDGPDAVEGGVHKVNSKNRENVAPPQVYNKPQNKKRF